MKLKFFLWICLCCLITQAQAAVMLGGKGLSHEYTTTAGQRTTGVLELRNTGKQPAEVKLYQEDLTARNPRSNKTWIRLAANRLILAPGAKQTVAYTIQVPAGAGQGTYWSAIMLEPVSNKSRESQLQKPTTPGSFTLNIETVTRYAVTVMTHLGTGAAKLAFSAPKIETDTAKQKVFAINIQNTGNRYTYPVVTLEVFNAQGNPLKTIKADSHSLFPGSNKRFTLALQGLTPGTYKALLTAEDDHNGKTFGTDVTLNILP